MSYRRKKQKGRQEKITANLPVVEVVHTLEGEDCTCEWCHAPLRRIGQKVIHEVVVFQLVKLYKEVTLADAYECPQCKADGADVIMQAPVPKLPFRHSLASPSLLAQVFYEKFGLSLPLYRQEKNWQSLGLDIPRRTLTNWVIKASELYLEPLWELMKKKRLQEERLHADETPYNVLSSDKRKTYIGLFRTLESCPTPIILYQHAMTRSGQVAKDFLKDFQGYLHTDAYSGYPNSVDVESVLCWAHARRYFVAAQPTSGEHSIARQGIADCDALFKIERQMQKEGLTPEAIYQERLEKSKSIMEKLFHWLESLPVLKGSKLGQAKEYLLNQKEGVMTVLKDGRCALSNKLAERSIRPTTIGRKNFLFSVSEAGAKANAMAYSIIETAKANGLNPRKYLNYIFEQLPNMPEIKSLALEDYLPWAKEVQAQCK